MSSTVGFAVNRGSEVTPELPPEETARAMQARAVMIVERFNPTFFRFPRGAAATVEA